MMPCSAWQSYRWYYELCCDRLSTENIRVLICKENVCVLCVYMLCIVSICMCSVLSSGIVSSRCYRRVDNQQQRLSGCGGQSAALRVCWPALLTVEWWTDLTD